MKPRHCCVFGCQRLAVWGKRGFPGFVCDHHSRIWADSQERLDVLQLGRDWAEGRALHEAQLEEAR